MTVCAVAHLLLLMGEIEYGARGSSFLGDDWYWERGRGGNSHGNLITVMVGRTEQNTGEKTYL